ncbi:MAG: glycoside hydrolase domain-containing protein [Planctomycetota bacterium]
MKKTSALNTTLVACLAMLASPGVAQPEIRDYRVPTTTAPIVENSAVLFDGIVADGEWSAASRFGDFLVVARLGADNDETLLNRAVRNTTLRVQATPQGLVLGAVAETGPMNLIKAKFEGGERDVAVWEDDSLEFILYNPKADLGFVAIINPRGALFDGTFRSASGGSSDVNGDPNIDAESFAGHIDQDARSWSAELRIPWSLVGGSPDDGDVWRFNVKRYERTGVFSAWSPANDIAGIESSGRLRFRSDVAVQTDIRLPRVVADRVDDTTPPTYLVARAQYSGAEKRRFSAYNKVMAEVAADQAEATLALPEFLTTMGFSRRTLPLKEILDFSMGGSIELGTGETIGITATAEPEPGQQYVAELQLNDADNFDDPLHHQLVPFVWSEPVAFAVNLQRWFLTDGTVKLTVPAAGLPDIATDADHVRVGLRRRGAERELIEMNRAFDESTISLDMSSLEAGLYDVEIGLVRAGEVVLNRTIPLEKPAEPVWANNSLGRTDELLPPWEPIAYSGNTATTTNRIYTFGEELLPQQITVRLDRGDQALLAAPARFVVNGQLLRPQGQPEIVEQSETRWVRRQSYIGPSLTLNIRATLEYDGFYYLEVETATAARVESFRLEVPVRSEAGTHYWRGYNGLKPIDAFSKAEWPWGGELPDEQVDIGFAPTVRLHDLDHGLEWFAEHNWHWRNAEESKQIVIRPVADSARVLEVNFRGEPGHVEAGSRFDFGLIAIPTKPFALPWDEIMLSSSTGIADAVHFAKIEPARNPAMWMPGRTPPSQVRSGVFVHYPLHNNLDPRGGELQLNFSVIDGSEHDLFWIDFGDTEQNEGLHARLFRGDGSSRIRLADSAGNEATLWTSEDLESLRLTWHRTASGTDFTLEAGGDVATLRSSLSAELQQLHHGVLLLGGQSRLWLDRLTIADANEKPLLDDAFDDDFLPNDYRTTKAGGAVDRVGSFVDGRLRLDVQTSMLKHDVHHRQGITGVYTHWHARNNFLGPWYEIDGPEREAQYARYHATREPTRVDHLPYFLKNMATHDAAWPDFGAEVSIQPTAISFDHTVVAPSGPGQDFIVWAIHRLLTEMDADYIHLDFGLPFPDAALGTGAGSIGPDGELRFSYPILAHRELYKRIYKMCLDNNAKFVPHTSPGIEMSYGSFAHAGVTGEQEQFYFDFDHHQVYINPTRSYLTDDRYLSHYPGILLGTPHYQLGAGYLTVMTGDVNMTWATYLTKTFGDYPGSEDAAAGGHLLRDGVFTPYLAAAEEQLVTGSMMNRLNKYFVPILADYGDANFVPFFRAEASLGITTDVPDDVFVSVAMQTDRPEALLIVGNHAHQNHEATIEFNATALGIDGPAEVYDPVMRRVLKQESIGRVRVNTPKEMIRPLIVRPER